MRVAYNAREDTAYISLTEFDDGEAVRQHELVEHDIGGELSFDFDKSGRLLGIRVAFASMGLPREFVDAAERVKRALERPNCAVKCIGQAKNSSARRSTGRR